MIVDQHLYTATIEALFWNCTFSFQFGTGLIVVFQTDIVDCELTVSFRFLHHERQIWFVHGQTVGRRWTFLMTAPSVYLYKSTQPEKHLMFLQPR